MYKIIETITWHDNRVEKPDNQDIPCLIIQNAPVGELTVEPDLYIWNGAAWWHADGGRCHLDDDLVIRFAPVLQV